jgi:hypothetical protein
MRGGSKKGVPVLSRSFASAQISPGELWRVYLQAFDPEGDMKAIYCLAEQPGIGAHPVSITRILNDQQGELSGYLYLKTAGATGLNFGALSLTVQTRDQAGNFSEPVSFSFSFNPRAPQEEVPPSLFQDQELGPITITLTSGSAG